jgi:dCTP deaminase
MYLSDRDLLWAIEQGTLIVDPKPAKIDPTSIDLHLDSVEQAKVWDIEAFNKDMKVPGGEPKELRIGKFTYDEFAPKYLKQPSDDSEQLVFRRGQQVIVKPGGFLLWQTKEWVGTPDGATLIAFVDGKSTRARTGILVHLTAPTIHATWAGNITLEIANLGPFHFVLQEGDSIAQIVVATISSIPSETMKKSVTYRQTDVSAASGAKKQVAPSPQSPKRGQSDRPPSRA